MGTLVVVLARGYRHAVRVEICKDLLPDLHRGVPNTAPQPLTLQDTPIDVVVKEDASICCSAVVTLGEATLGRLAQHKREVRPMAFPIQVTNAVLMMLGSFLLVLRMLLVFLTGELAQFVL